MIDATLLDRAIATITFQAGYNTSVVLVGTTALGVAAGVVGSFAFLRRRALLSDALSHATLPGIALGFLLGIATGGEGRSLPLLLAGAAGTGALGVVAVQVLTRFTRISEDAAIGIVLSVFYGVGIVLLSYIQNLSVGGQAGLKTFILGQTAAMRRGEAIALALMAAAAIGATLLLFKEFRLVCFDAAFARSQGWPVARIDLLMAGLTVFVTVIGLQTVGLILIVALLILPPVAARFWTDHLPRMLVVSGAIGGVSGFAGATVSAVLPDMPTGAVIVLVAGTLFVVSMTVAPARGLLAAAMGRAAFQLRLAEVRALARLAGPGGTSATVGSGVALRLRARGLIDVGGALTVRGRHAAAAALRNLRLWEAALAEGAEAIPPGVRWGVDPIDAALPPDLVARLEARSVS